MHYEKKVISQHVIHIVTLDNNEHIAQIIKSNNGKGRETVASIAKKTKSNIAINGVFFNIGGQNDGTASRTLIIEGKIYNLQKKEQPLLIINNGIISIMTANPKNYINQKHISVLAGKPMLIENGKISQNIFSQKTDFYNQPHARTAIGLNNDGKVIIVIVEHSYLSKITDIVIEKIKSLVKKFSNSFQLRYTTEISKNTNLNKSKNLNNDSLHISSNTNIRGLTILELAKFMKECGCENAINLDGGGSSTLCIDGMVINNIFGDKDENIGKQIARTVSDAIIFKKK